jgi:hypothetical protein
MQAFRGKHSSSDQRRKKKEKKKKGRGPQSEAGILKFG